jgi:hypothetical protein
MTSSKQAAIPEEALGVPEGFGTTPRLVAQNSKHQALVGVTPYLV